MKSFSKEKWRENAKNEKQGLLPRLVTPTGVKGGSCAHKRPPPPPPLLPRLVTPTGVKDPLLPRLVPPTGAKGLEVYYPGRSHRPGQLHTLHFREGRRPAGRESDDAVRLPIFSGEPQQRRPSPPPRNPSSSPQITPPSRPKTPDLIDRKSVV